MWRYILIFSAVIFLGSAHADTLWSTQTASVFNAVRAWKVGDIVMVHILLKASAVHEAGTNTSRQSGISAEVYDLYDQYSVDSGSNKGERRLSDLRLRGKNNFRGMGSTSRKSSVKATISAVVIGILENGNLLINGEQMANINNETEVIQIKGVVRPQDIAEDNSVKSQQIAGLNVSVKGQGIVGEKQSPGMVANMFNWIF